MKAKKIANHKSYCDIFMVKTINFAHAEGSGQTMLDYNNNQ